jgi:hypothetical protein
MNEIAPAADGGQRQNQDRRGSDFTKLQPINHPKNRELVLEELANKWASMGYYKTPTRALLALLGHV